MLANQNAATTKGMLWKDLRQQLFVPGMREAKRIVKPGIGQVWVKCKDQVQSGMQRWCHIDIYIDAVQMGLGAQGSIYPHRQVPNVQRTLEQTAPRPQTSQLPVGCLSFPALSSPSRSSVKIPMPSAKGRFSCITK